MKARKTRPKRKNTKLTPIDEPEKGALPLRQQHYRVNETKILPEDDRWKAIYKLSVHHNVDTSLNTHVPRVRSVLLDGN